MNDSEQSGSNLEFDKIHDALEKSTVRNSRQLLSFVLIQLYLLITVAATTDLQLLLPDSKVTLPLLNVELPLFWFYIAAPVLIVIFHFHYLINLLQHARKLKAWDEAKSNQQNVLLPGFIFNFSILFKQITINYRLLRFLQAAILCFFPLLLLLFIQIRFADYHSVPMTAWHFVLVFLDFLVLLIYWYRINYPELLNEKYDTFKILLSVLGKRRKKKGDEKESNPPEKVASRGYLWAFVLVQIVSLSCLLIVVLLSFNYFKERHFFIPYINLPGETLVKPPSNLIIQAYAFQGKNVDSVSIELEQGIDLSSRNLQFANMSRANLRKVSLDNANLNGADLYRALLNGANLRYAQLNGALLTRVQLNGADLWSADLNGANLAYAQLNGADLGYVQLNGAQLPSAQLNGANLLGAQLNGAELSSAYLNGAKLWMAQLNGATLVKVKLNGASLYETQLNGASLYEAQLNGANLLDAQLNGANLRLAQLNGASLKKTQLNGASLFEAQLNGANLRLTQLGGTYIERASVRGIFNFISAKYERIFFFTSLDFHFVPDWDNLMTTLDTMRLSKILLREEALSRLRNAKANSANLDSGLKYLKPDLAGFIEVRKELSCQSTYIARGMLTQYLSDTVTVQVRNDIIQHMHQNCPDTLMAIKPLLSEELSYKIDSIMQASK